MLKKQSIGLFLLQIVMSYVVRREEIMLSCLLYSFHLYTYFLLYFLHYYPHSLLSLFNKPLKLTQKQYPSRLWVGHPDSLKKILMTLIISLYFTQLRRRKSKHPVKSYTSHHIRIGGIFILHCNSSCFTLSTHAYIYAHLKNNSTQLNFSGFDEQSKNLLSKAKQVARFL